MSVCGFCSQEMSALVSCTQAVYSDLGDDRLWPRRRYGTEWDGGSEADRERLLRLGSLPPHCSDCGTPKDGLHHPGCCVERCPRCGWQIIACGCGKE